MKTPVQEYFEEIDKTYYDYKTLEEQQELLNDAKQKEKRAFMSFWVAGRLSVLSSNEFDKNRDFETFYNSIFNS